MTQAIIYLQDDGRIALVVPTGELSVKKVAAKDVPPGKPYLIIDASDVPSDSTFFDAWEADFTNAPVAGS